MPPVRRSSFDHLAFARILVFLLLSVHTVHANDLRIALQKVDGLLSVSEVLNRAFKNEYDVEAAQVTVADGRLCAETTPAAVLSRQFLEDSWTSAESVSGDIEAMFNAQSSCFMKYAGICEAYAVCADPTSVFDSSAVPREGLHWTANQSTVRAWQREQLALLDHLLLTADDSSSLAQRLRDDLEVAARQADFGIAGMRSILEERRAGYSSFVNIDTGPVPVAGAAPLPTSLLGLASRLQDLVASIPSLASSSCGSGWESKAQDVALQLDGQDDVIAGIDASLVMELTQFDFLRRAVEALAVGASLALEAAALAAVAELNCKMKFSPRTAAVSAVDAVQDAANGVLTKLIEALPSPSDSSAAAAPLRRCLNTRLEDARDRLPQASATLVISPRPLLSLDFCGRLFNATAREVISAGPYAGDRAFTSTTELFAVGGEQRQMQFDTSNSLAFVGPFASYTSRTAAATSMFTSGDQVIQLQAVEEMTLRAQAPEAEDAANDGCTTLPTIQVAACAAGCESCDPGCWWIGPCSGQWVTCYLARPGYWSDGTAVQACDSVAGGSSQFYAFGWPNSSCPFICEEADQRPSDRSCIPVGIGEFSPVCNNTWASCATPDGIPDPLFKAVANFTTKGRGKDGCEITLAFPAATPAATGGYAAAVLAPPFTVELFANVSLDAVPVGSTSARSMALLVGSFPTWFLALRRSSAGSAQLLFYHSRITLASHLSAEDSVIASNPFSWDNSRQAWRHVAVVVEENFATRHNVFFYADGELVSSGYRVVSAVDILPAPYIIPEHRDVFHVGPVNVKRFPEFVAAGRPYYDLPLYTGQLDEVRVHREALDGLALGSQITELRRRAACDPPFEQLEGSACQALPRLTSPNTSSQQSECRAGFELCGGMPGICMEACPGDLLRQADCSCDCPPTYFQTWRASAIHLTGSGEVRNATIYNAEHAILGSLGFAALPQRIALSPDPSQVAVVEVWGGASASYVSLEVETPAPSSQRLPVAALHDVALQGDRPTLLHHRSVLTYADPSLGCSRCAGEAPRSVLPREDALSCRCADGYGPNLLGKCVPLGGPLQSPVINLANGTYHTAGTRVRLSLPAAQDVEAPWLLSIHYEYGDAPQAATCDTSLKYEEPANDPAPGLDILRRQEAVVVRAVLCHPMRAVSLESRTELYGNDIMNPPRCVVVSAELSTDSAYALQVEVDLRLDQQPDATIFYEIQGSGGQATFVAPLLLTTPGVVTISAWAERLGFDPSTRTTCAYEIDGQARIEMALQWPALGDSPLAGFATEEQAWMAPRGTEDFSFVLAVSGVPDNTPGLQLQYRLERGSLGFSSWEELPPSRGLVLRVAENLEAPNRTTLLQIQWRAKEPGRVWTTPGNFRVLFVESRAEAPIVTAEPVELWSLGDSWFPGSNRERALRQVHRVQLVHPSSSARVLFSVRAEIGQTEDPSTALLAVNSNNVSSLRTAFVERFRSAAPSVGLSPEAFPGECSGVALIQAAEVPKLCDYLGQFQVLGGAVVTAYALVAGELESLPSSFLVPKEVEPSRDDLTFQAVAEATGHALAIQEVGVKAMPSTAESLIVTVGQPTAERQSCVLATPFRFSATNGTTKSISDCSWIMYNGPRKLFLDNLLTQAGLAAGDDVTLNVTVLTTVRRNGYLWSFPTASSFFWFRERTPAPKVVQVLEPGAATPAAMVWLQEGGQANNARSYFTLHYEPLQLSDVPAPFLVEVPSLTATVASFGEAFRPTTRADGVHASGDWRTNVDLCAWPAVCELPLNGTLPTELVYVPSGYSRLCAWAIWPGYLESTPSCKLIGPLGTTQVTQASFVPQEATAAQLAALDPDVAVPEEVGSDTALRAQLLQIPTGGANSSGRRLSAPAEVFPLFLERSHPLQYRFGAVALDARVFLQPGITQESLTSTMQLSEWRDLGLAAAPPLLSWPSRQVTDHILFVVDVRLLTGVNRWSAESRSVAVLLAGQQPSLSISRTDGRRIQVQSARANSTIFFQWILGTASSSFGNELVRIQSGATALGDVFAVSAEAELLDSVDASLCTVAVDALADDRRRLCVWQADAPLEMTVPSSDRVTLWVTASSPGLPSSTPATLSVEAQCAAPSGVAFAMAPSCSGGQMIESGENCSAQCEPGYLPSVATLRCHGGSLAPREFLCLEMSCRAPSNVSYAAVPGCMEGDTVSPGGRCTPACEGGYVPSEALLSCARGQLSPGSFRCDEAACDAPSDVLYASSPSCSGLLKIGSRSTCVPQCQDGYLPAPGALQCIRGQLTPESFVCEPGVTVDMGLIIASVPSALLAGALALMVGYCARGGRAPPKTVEQDDSDPLQEWWTCVQEVEPGICVFCGRQPEEVETRYEDHGPASLFRSCRACATLLGFEEEEEDEEEEAEEGAEEETKTTEAGLPQRASVESLAPGNDIVKSLSEAPAEPEGSEPEDKTPPSLLGASPGSISDAVAGLQMDDLLKDQASDGPVRPELERLSGAPGNQSQEPAAGLTTHEYAEDASTPLREAQRSTRTHVRQEEVDPDSRTPRRSDFAQGRDAPRLSNRRAIELRKPREEHTILDSEDFQTARPSQRRYDASRYTAAMGRAAEEDAEMPYSSSRRRDRRPEEAQELEVGPPRSRRTRDTRRSPFTTDPDENRRSSRESPEHWSKVFADDAEDRRRTRQHGGQDSTARQSAYRSDRSERPREAREPRRSQARGADRQRQRAYE